jgi:hypothetical protein
MPKEENIMALIIRWILTFLISIIIVGITLLIKPINSMKLFILFLNIEGTILIAFAFSNSNPVSQNSFWSKIRWLCFEQPAKEYAEPLVPNLLMLYIGIFFIILANIISILVN